MLRKRAQCQSFAPALLCGSAVESWIGTLLMAATTMLIEVRKDRAASSVLPKEVERVLDRLYNL